MIVRYFFFILCCAIFAPLAQAQNLRKWTNNEGQSFTGSIIDFKPKYEAAVGHLHRESQKNIKDTLKLEKFGISEKSINKFFSTGLYKGLLDEGDPVLVLAMMSKTIPKPDINMGFFYKLTNGKGIELGIKTMNPPFVFGFIGMYENAKLKLDTTIELESKELTIVADTIYNLPDEVKNGFTLVRYFEITKINDNTYNEPYLAFIYKKKIDKDN